MFTTSASSSATGRMPSLSTEPAFGGLEVHQGPAGARDISTYAEDGTYRFTKGQVNLKRGWVMTLADEEELRQALDQFYPACVGLFLAWQEGTLESREPARQAQPPDRHVSLRPDRSAMPVRRNSFRKSADPPTNARSGSFGRSTRKLRWRTARRAGSTAYPATYRSPEAIPLLCREACNHFVAECRKAAKAEFEAKSADA